MEFKLERDGYRDGYRAVAGVRVGIVFCLDFFLVLVLELEFKLERDGYRDGYRDGAGVRVGIGFWFVFGV